MRIGQINLILVLLGALGLQTAQAGIVTNGSFETDVVPPPGYETLPSLAGWTIDITRSAANATGIELQAGVAGSANTGSNLVELDGIGSTFRYQDVATTAGQQYFLTFAFSARPQYSNCVGTPSPATCQPSGGSSINENGTENHMQVLVGAPGALNVLFDGTQNGVGAFNTAWINPTVFFTASGNTTRIEFGDAGISDGYGTFLDSVNSDITSAPEPGTMLMIGAGVVGIAISRFRKTR